MRDSCKFGDMEGGRGVFHVQLETQKLRNLIPDISHLQHKYNLRLKYIRHSFLPPVKVRIQQSVPEFFTAPGSIGDISEAILVFL
jgi:hypothetical protein